MKFRVTSSAEYITSWSISPQLHVDKNGLCDHVLTFWNWDWLYFVCTDISTLNKDALGTKIVLPAYHSHHWLFCCQSLRTHMPTQVAVKSMADIDFLCTPEALEVLDRLSNRKSYQSISIISTNQWGAHRLWEWPCFFASRIKMSKFSWKRKLSR